MDMQHLQAGEILVQTIHQHKSGGAARVTGKNEFIYVRGLEVCEVLMPGLQYIKKHHRVKNNWFTPTLDFVFEARRTSKTHGDFNLVEGDLKVMEGQWDFQLAPGRDIAPSTRSQLCRSASARRGQLIAS